LTVIIVAAIFLTPILRSPLLGDDAFNSYMTGYMKYHGIFGLDFLQIYNSRVIAAEGRFIPGMTLLQFTMWSLTQSAVTIKTVQVLAILSDVLLLYVFVIKYSRSRSLALWSSLIVLATFEIRDFYDPYAGIVIVMQLIMAALLGSFILIVDELDGPSSGWRIPLSVALYAVACLTYETAYLYLAIIVLLFWFRSGSIRTTLAGSSPFVAVLAILGVIDLFARSAAKIAAVPIGTPTGIGEWAIAFKPLVVLGTWYWQTAGAIPLVYVALDPKHYFPSFERIVFRHSTIAPLLFVATLVTGFLFLRNSAARSPENRRGVPLWQSALIGALMAILPGALIALSPRWQLEVTPGLAYLPVYQAGFGIAILIGTCLAWLLAEASPVRTAVGLIVPFAVALVILVTYQANALTLALYDPTWNWSRENLTQSFKLGLLDAAPPDAAVYLDETYPFFYGNAFIWDTRYLAYLYSNKRVAVYPQSDIGSTSSLCQGQSHGCVPTVPAFQFFNHPLTFSSGATTLVRIDRVEYDEKTGIAVGHEATIVERGDEIGIRPATVARALDDRDFTIEAVGPNWRRFHVATTCGAVSANVFSSADFVDLTFGTGFYGLEQAAGSSWHWAKSNAELIVTNAIGKTLPADVALTLEALDPRPSTVNVRFGTTQIVKQFAGKAVDVHLHVDLKPYQPLRIDVSTTAVKPASIPDPRDLHFRVIDAHVTSLSTLAHC